jgi:hypothetical protein
MENAACAGRTSSGRWRASSVRIATIMAALTVSACAVPSHYAGIDLTPQSSTAPEVQALAQRARSGDKQSQLDLGIRYEEGRGVPTDPKRARKLYQAAATTTGGTIFVYVPATRKGGRGYTMPVNMVPGLAAARVRLATLRNALVAEEVR